MKIKLTDRSIKSLKPPALGQRLEIVDTVQRGLRLRVTDRGVKSWSISCRVNGRRRRFSIGPYPAISLAQARDRAGQLLVEVREGRDPVAEVRAARQADKTPDAITLQRGIELYAKAVLAHRRRGRQIERDLRRDLAELLPVPTSAVTTAQLAHIIDAKASFAPVSANRLVGYMKPFWRWLSHRGHCDVDPARDLSKPTKETARDRMLSRDELGRVWRATLDMGRLWGPFFRLVILTAQRREELASIRWSEIELDRATWTLPGERTKTGRAHIIHLSDPACAMLHDLWNQRREDTDLVFTTTGRTAISGFSKAKGRLDDISKVVNWRLHDLRRTFASHCVDMGIDPVVADRVLNHAAAGTMSTVQRIYQRSEMLEPRRHALDAWSAWVFDAADGGIADGKVVLLHGI